MPGVASSPFPQSDRVLYRRNPLVSVICQVRFSPILKIDVEPPAAFQESIRAEYPIMRDRSQDAIPLPVDLPEAVKGLVVRATIGRTRPQAAYDFASDDDRWTVSLTREFLSLATNRYERWEDFLARLEGPFAALVHNYSPAFSRIGLRYQDLINPNALGLSGRPWAELLRPHMTGMLSARDLDAAAVTENFSQSLIRLPVANSSVAIRNGLVENESKEVCYLIDSDFYTEHKLEAEGVKDVLNYFNQQSGRLFRWCTTEVLQNAMEPESLPQLG